MRYPLDELIDKKSIIRLKIDRTETEFSEKKRWIDEIVDYSLSIGAYIGEGICTEEQIKNWYVSLYEVNGRIWDLEAEIRQGKEKIFGLEEVGRRALLIRDINSERVKIKTEIVEKTGIGYKNIKVNHASDN